MQYSNIYDPQPPPGLFCSVNQSRPNPGSIPPTEPPSQPFQFTSNWHRWPPPQISFFSQTVAPPPVPPPATNVASYGSEWGYRRLPRPAPHPGNVSFSQHNIGFADNRQFYGPSNVREDEVRRATSREDFHKTQFLGNCLDVHNMIQPNRNPHDNLSDNHQGTYYSEPLDVASSYRAADFGPVRLRPTNTYYPPPSLSQTIGGPSPNRNAKAEPEIYVPGRPPQLHSRAWEPSRLNHCHERYVPDQRHRICQDVIPEGRRSNCLDLPPYWSEPQPHARERSRSPVYHRNDHSTYHRPPYEFGHQVPRPLSMANRPLFPVAQSDSDHDYRLHTANREQSSSSAKPLLAGGCAAAERIASETLLGLPGRKSRPAKMLFILRGLPGSGKSTVGRLIKTKETEAALAESSEAAVRLLSIDDFFMTEVDSSNVPVYTYEAEMEAVYQKQLVKLLCRQMDDGYFTFLIVDAVNQRVTDLDELAAQARSRHFQVYIVDVSANLSTCIRRSEGRRSREDIIKMQAEWEPTPSRYIVVDANSLQQEVSSEEVEMEADDGEEDLSGVLVTPTTLEETLKKTELNSATGDGKQRNNSDSDDDENDSEGDFTPKAFSWAIIRSKWDNEDTAQRIEKLDGMTRQLRHSASSNLLNMTEYIQSTEKNYSERKAGVKRVTWADVEALCAKRRKQAVGFVVGQSDWGKLTTEDDEKTAVDALVQIRYF